MEVRGAVLREVGKPLGIETLTLAPPGPGELLVRVRAAGLCHSDLSVIDGSRPRPVPMVLGHEAAGEVVEAGPGSDFRPGEHVVLTFVPSCGDCVPCTAGRPALCGPAAAANRAGTLLGGDVRWSSPAGNPLHHLGVSAFASHVVVSERSAVRIDRALPFEIAALFGCAVLTGAGAVFNAADVRPGDSVAVFGLGGVGLSALLAAKAAGASTLLAIDPVPSKRELARSLGATVLTGGVAEIRERTGGGVDHAVDTTGVVAALSQAYEATRPGGTTVTVGLPDPSAGLTLPAQSLVAEEKTLRGSYLGSCVPRRDVPRFIALYQAGLLPVEALLTHSITLDEINEGFARLRDGGAVRQVIAF
ncbi:alcohol dehydrogenase [Amycolatopsis sp. AA4]|uniref:zinc-binding dehydrogenase n=1 Tax=Actinomycetes TaxID=1760 RepID=UPI0001B585D6|nr:MULTISPECIES: zinc-binding dehydrogenase [Actinomycetes]ATY11910.1 alcohol dehydrogenase [Amycolatopsis sp. AA4]EFL07602.1 mycothiol-dependent formaldehyde dehydrogenase [Streptomyces sp. AA4]